MRKNKNKNEYLLVGMLFMVLGLILNKSTNISDLMLGILYGISIGVLVMGIINKKK